jgi:uncharacterized protein
MSKRLRVVMDTNIFISAILFKGPANKLVDLWQKGEFLFLMSQGILNEYIKVLSYPKFRLTGEEVTHIIETDLIPYINPVSVKTNIAIVKDDPSDNMFLALGMEGKADRIVSGDKHLLELGEYSKIRIISLKKFLSLY